MHKSRHGRRVETGTSGPVGALTYFSIKMESRAAGFQSFLIFMPAPEAGTRVKLEGSVPSGCLLKDAQADPLGAFNRRVSPQVGPFVPKGRLTQKVVSCDAAAKPFWQETGRVPSGAARAHSENTRETVGWCLPGNLPRTRCRKRR